MATLLNAIAPIIVMQIKQFREVNADLLLLFFLLKFKTNNTIDNNSKANITTDHNASNKELVSVSPSILHDLPLTCTINNQEQITPYNVFNTPKVVVFIVFSFLRKFAISFCCYKYNAMILISKATINKRKGSNNRIIATVNPLLLLRFITLRKNKSMARNANQIGIIPITVQTKT